jgi:hypothetical protein
MPNGLALKKTCPCTLIFGLLMWAILARSTTTAFSLSSPIFRNSHRSLAHVGGEQLCRTNRALLFTTLKPTEIDELEAQIKAKGDQIRQLKTEGVDKEGLSIHIEELVAMKAQLPPVEDVKAKKEKSSTKEKKPQGGNQKKQAAPTEATESLSESELRLNRLSKISSIREAGVEPFEYRFVTTHTSAQLVSLYKGKLLVGEEDEQANVAVAGRIMTRRLFGKLAFFTLQDETGTIQLQFDKNRLDEAAFLVRQGDA